MARILVIDDDELMRKLLRELLSKAGHEVVEADDGDVGLELYKENPADLVITDIFMAKKSGLEVIQELRRSHPDTRFILITGFGIRDELDVFALARQYGIEHAFEKPFEQDAMLSAVTELLGEQG